MGDHSSRRSFLKNALTGVCGAAAGSGIGAGTAGTAVVEPQAPAAPPSKPLDFTRGSSDRSFDTLSGQQADKCFRLPRAQGVNPVS